MSVVASMKTCDAVWVVYVVASLRNRLCHTHTGSEKSSKDQCHAHDSYKLTSSAEKLALCRSHHLPNSLHIHIHPHRIPHERLDRCKNFAALTHDAAPTKNYVFDSHWQQWRSIRWKYTAAKTSADLQTKRYVRVVVVRVLVCAGRIHEVQRVIQLAMGLRWWGSIPCMANMQPCSCSCGVLRGTRSS